jgi:hypothetical protein
MLKKILLIISLLFISSINVFWAWDYLDPLADESKARAWAESKFWKWWYVKITVQEPIPWQNCTISAWEFENWWALEKCRVWEWRAAWSVEKITDLICPASMTYDCYQEKGFWSLKTMIWEFIKFLTYLVWLIWVLYIVINWIMLSMSWFNSGMKENVKKGIIQAILWIILLFLWGFLLVEFAPWIYK